MKKSIFVILEKNVDIYLAKIKFFYIKYLKSMMKYDRLFAMPKVTEYAVFFGAHSTFVFRHRPGTRRFS